jgi:hypothetical protein
MSNPPAVLKSGTVEIYKLGIGNGYQAVCRKCGEFTQAPADSQVLAWAEAHTKGSQCTPPTLNS